MAEVLLAEVPVAEAVVNGDALQLLVKLQAWMPSGPGFLFGMLTFASVWFIIIVLVSHFWQPCQPKIDQLLSFKKFLKKILKDHQLRAAAPSTLEDANSTSQLYVPYTIADMETVMKLEVLRIVVQSFYAVIVLVIVAVVLPSAAVPTVLTVTSMLFTYGGVCVFSIGYAEKYIPWARAFLSEETMAPVRTWWIFLGAVAMTLGMSYAPILCSIDPLEDVLMWLLVCVNLGLTIATNWFAVTRLIRTQLNMAKEETTDNATEATDKAKLAQVRAYCHIWVSVAATCACVPIYPTTYCIIDDTTTSADRLSSAKSAYWMMGVGLGFLLMLAIVWSVRTSPQFKNVVQWWEWVLLGVFIWTESATLAGVGLLRDPCVNQYRLGWMIFSGIMSISLNTLIVQALVDACLITTVKIDHED